MILTGRNGSTETYFPEQVFFENFSKQRGSVIILENKIEEHICTPDLINYSLRSNLDDLHLSTLGCIYTCIVSRYIRF